MTDSCEQHGKGAKDRVTGSLSSNDSKTWDAAWRQIDKIIEKGIDDTTITSVEYRELLWFIEPLLRRLPGKSPSEVLKLLMVRIVNEARAGSFVGYTQAAGEYIGLRDESQPDPEPVAYEELRSPKDLRILRGGHAVSTRTGAPLTTLRNAGQQRHRKSACQALLKDIIDFVANGDKVNKFVDEVKRAPNESTVDKAKEARRSSSSDVHPVMEPASSDLHQTTSLHEPPVKHPTVAHEGAKRRIRQAPAKSTMLMGAVSVLALVGLIFFVSKLDLARPNSEVGQSSALSGLSGSIESIEQRYDGKDPRGRDGDDSKCADPPLSQPVNSSQPPLVGPDGQVVGSVELRSSPICPVIWARANWTGGDTYTIPPGWTFHMEMHRPATSTMNDFTLSGGPLKYGISNMLTTLRGCVYADMFFVNGNQRTFPAQTSCVKQ